ncbi:MAG: hypothetical protein ACF8XB_03295 [Planctomycetota bacterium JB042]
MNLSVLLVLSLAAPSTWTVDDDGPADFSSIRTALFNVAPGDTLLVEPGTYGPFVATQRVTILGRFGPPRPKILDKSYVIGAPAVTIVGLEFESLTVKDVVGRALVDDCEIEDGDLVIDSCERFLLSRIEVRTPAAAGGIGADVVSSHGFMVLCDVEGGDGPGGSIFGTRGGDGGSALRVRGGSEVTIVASRLIGGKAGVGFVDGRAGDGLLVEGGTAVVRGAPHDVLDDGAYDTCCGGTPGFSIQAESAATVVWSGVSLPAGIGGTGAVTQAPAAEPYVYVTGDDLPGGHRSLRVLGTPGVPAIVLFATEAKVVDVPRYDGQLWLDPSALDSIWVATTPGSASIPLPTAPGLEGKSLVVQAGFPTVPSTTSPGDHLLSNPALVVMRF